MPDPESSSTFNGWLVDIKDSWISKNGHILSNLEHSVFGRPRLQSKAMKEQKWGGREYARAINQFLTRTLGWSPQEINTGWEDVLVPAGLSQFATAFGNAESTEWVRSWTHHHLTLQPTYEARNIKSVHGGGEQVQGIYLYDYCGNWGFPLVDRSVLTGALRERADAVAREVGDHIITGAARGPEGVVLHGGHAYTVWVDTLYYTAAPLARLYAETGERRYADEAVKQCLLHARYLLDDRTGLFFHDWSPESGMRSSNFWARGNGWIIMAFAETLRHVDESFQAYSELVEIYRRLVDGLLRYRQSSGMWRLIPENDDSPLETSGTTMFLTGMTIGIGLGILEKNLGKVVMESFLELSGWICMKKSHPNSGALMGSEAPASRGGWETHKSVGIGESTYTSGTFLNLLAKLKETELI